MTTPNRNQSRAAILTDAEIPTLAREHHHRHAAAAIGGSGAGLSGRFHDRKRTAPGSETRPTCHRADGGKRLHDPGQHRTNEATMPRRNKGARLWLRPEARKNGK